MDVDDIEAPPPAADEDDDADMTGEASNRESEPDEPIDGEASDDEPVDGAASFPVGSWVRHAALGKNGIVIRVYDDGECYGIKCDGGTGTTTWRLSALEPAPGTAPAELAVFAASCCTKRGDWVRDTETGAIGVIVDVIGANGARIILCESGEIRR